jgi:biotin carboxyl carrier protein
VVNESKFEQKELDAITALFEQAPHLTNLKVSWGEVQFELSKAAGQVKVDGPLKRAALVTVRSQTVGTFFRTAAPTTAPYVEVGTTVRADSVIGRIEALGRTSTISAGFAGRIVAIVATDGQKVEYGQPLATIEPDR